MVKESRGYFLTFSIIWFGGGSKMWRVEASIVHYLYLYQINHIYIASSRRMTNYNQYHFLSTGLPCLELHLLNNLCSMVPVLGFFTWFQSLGELNSSQFSEKMLQYRTG